MQEGERGSAGEMKSGTGEEDEVENARMLWWRGRGLSGLRRVLCRLQAGKGTRQWLRSRWVAARGSERADDEVDVEPTRTAGGLAQPVRARGHKAHSRLVFAAG